MHVSTLVETCLRRPGLTLLMMAHGPDIAATAALFGDPARAAMLLALLDKTAMSAGQLAFVANISPQTASFHLAKLTSAALLKGQRRGRHQVYQLADAGVANAIEALAALSTHALNGFGSDRMQQLRAARTCYDHLAGVAAVQFHDSLFQSGYLIHSGGKEYSLTDKGSLWLQSLGIDPKLPRTRSPLLRPCIDWSERRPHLAGRLAAKLLDLFLKDGWVVRIRDTRAVRITERGLREFERQYGLNLTRRSL